MPRRSLGRRPEPDQPIHDSQLAERLSWQENILLNRNAVVLQQFASQGWLSTLAAPEYLVNGVQRIPVNLRPAVF